jgi:acyl-CoA dehydrogenase
MVDAPTRDVPGLDEFGAEVVAFLDANATAKPPEREFVWGEGSDSVAVFEERDEDVERAMLDAAKAWRATRDDAGLGWISGPSEYGGRALSAAHQRRYDSLEAGYQVPNQSFFTIGLGMVAPTILAHGSDAAKTRLLASLYRGDVVACQLFSEPGSGSDLASLQTRAERDGDEWVVSGQKVWTTGAQFSDVGEVIARTDAELPKHRGLTGFIVDMHAPGVEVRPLRQMTGGASFNEVFFNDVRVPDEDRLGDVNQGWTVALTTLMNERAAIGGGGMGGGDIMAKVMHMPAAFGLADDAVTRQRLADLVIHTRVHRYTIQRAMDKIRSGQLPGPELSIAKLSGTENMRRIGDFVAGILGARLTADTGEWGTFGWNQLVLGTPGARVAGGTDEVMRNIVGERVLGLPKDPGIDTTSPFRELKVGTQTRGGERA